MNRFSPSNLKKTSLFVFFLLSISSVFSQLSKKDSLQSALKNEKSTEKKTLLKLEIGKVEADEQDSVCLVTLSQVIKEAETQNNFKAQIEANYWLGEFYLYGHNYPLAISFYNKAEVLARSHEISPLQKGWIYQETGSAYASQGDFKTSIELHAKAIAAFNNTKGCEGDIVFSYGTIGYSYLQLSKYAESMKYFTRALNYADSSGTEKNVPLVLGNMGILYESLGRYDDCLKMYFRSLALREKAGYKKGQMNLLFNISIIYQNQRKYKESDKYLEDGKKIAEENQDSFYLARYNYLKGLSLKVQQKCLEAIPFLKSAYTYYKRIGKMDDVGSAAFAYSYCLTETGKADEAMKYAQEAIEIFAESGDLEEESDSYMHLAYAEMKLKKWEQAAAHYETARKKLFELGNIARLSDVYKEMSQLNAEKGDYKTALDFFKKSAEMADSILSTQNSVASAEMNEIYQSEKKEAMYKADQLHQQEELDHQRAMRNYFTGGFIVVGILAIVIFVSLRRNVKAKKIIEVQKREVEKQKHEVEKQKEIVEEKNIEVMDSIHYARRIQRALISQDSVFQNYLNDHFILFQPKDVVSGDFYWGLKHAENFYLIAADCTGHGVPGAFMSLISISFLNEVIVEKNISTPDKILTEVRRLIIRALNPEGNEDGGKDGMDCILLSINTETKSISYAAANNSLYYFTNEKLESGNCDKMPVGKSPTDDQPFTLHHLSVVKNDAVYLLTDGFPDQFGGPKGKKFKYKQLENILSANAKRPMKDQSAVLLSEFTAWKGNLEQVDDVCIIGFRI